MNERKKLEKIERHRTLVSLREQPDEPSLHVIASDLQSLVALVADLNEIIEALEERLEILENDRAKRIAALEDARASSKETS
jgi:hypothetical protein